MVLPSLLWLLAACHPATIQLDEKSGNPGDDSTGSTTRDSDSGTPVDTETTATTPTVPPDCESYGWVADTEANLQQGSSFDAYDSRSGVWSDHNHTTTILAVNGATDCALTIGATVSGDVRVGGDPATVVCSQFGASISGTTSILASAVPMPVVTVPGGLPPSTGALNLGWNQAQRWETDGHLDSLYAGYGATMEVTQSLVLLVDGDFSMDQVPLIIAAGARLDLYVGGNVRLGYGAAANTDGEPARLRIFLVGAGTVTLDWGSALNAVVQTPDGQFSNNGGAFSGTWVGRRATAAYGASQHLDVSRLCP